jgi:DNA polymerase-4
MSAATAMTQSSLQTVPAFCRSCLAEVGAEDHCRSCHSRRIVRHTELNELAIAHLDCDAFYAAVEKRDNPELADKPVIIGGGRRGVVSTACYIARIHGVGSAMPMFKALKLCPDAVVIRPNMEKYTTVGRDVRQMMRDVTPLVEPLSIDEAFLDLTGTTRLHRQSPARSLAALQRRIESEIGVSASIGLSHNKYLAKVASDLDKPRGFSIIGRAETLDFLKARPVSLIWGVGKALQAKLATDGIRSIGQLQTADLKSLMAKYGSMGERLYSLARGIDNRRVSPHGDAKSISSETTFNTDIADFKTLERILWSLSEKVSRRAKAAGLAGGTVVLKLKSAGFRTRTRNRKLESATQLADRIFKAARPLLELEADGTEYRLIGVGITQLRGEGADGQGSLLDPEAGRRADVEHAMDRLRQKFGNAAIDKGLGFEGRRDKR